MLDLLLTQAVLILLPVTLFALYLVIAMVLHIFASIVAFFMD